MSRQSRYGDQLKAMGAGLSQLPVVENILTLCCRRLASMLTPPLPLTPPLLLIGAPPPDVQLLVSASANRASFVFVLA